MKNIEAAEAPSPPFLDADRSKGGGNAGTKK
jgi:hypothetical protein